MAVVAVDEVVPLEGPHLDKVEEAHPVVASHTAAVAVGAVVDLVDVVDASCVEAVGLDFEKEACGADIGTVFALNGRPGAIPQSPSDDRVFSGP